MKPFHIIIKGECNMFSKFFEFVGENDKKDIHSIEEFLEYCSGKSFLNGLYRIHSSADIPKWNAIVGKAFPEFAGRIKTFSYDWLGNHFALDLDRNVVLLFEPGSGEVSNLNEDFVNFHNEIMRKNRDECLNESFFAEWYEANDKYQLSSNECAGYIVPLFLNGSKELDNLTKYAMEVYWEIMTINNLKVRDIEIFDDFMCFARTDENCIQKYSGKIPVVLMEVWKRYGFGSFLGGYLRIINPNDYMDILKESYFRGDVSIPILATAFGDIITWEEGQYIRIVKYRYNNFELMIGRFDLFLKLLRDEGFLRRFFTLADYVKAVEKYGELESDECFGYVPLLALGGAEDVEHLKKVKMKEHIAVITQLTGGV